MTIKGWTAMSALILALSASAVHADEHRRVELKDGAQTITVIATEARTTAEMHVRVAGGAHDHEWEYRDQWLDQEVDSPVEIRKIAGDSYLFVHAYSGGAGCCWSLLVFDLNTGKAMGELLKGYSAIDVLEDKDAKCSITVTTVPQRIEYAGTNEGKLFRYCFDGTRFRKMGLSIRMPIAKPAG